jgi:3D (Asp-Asp-Asp) domain-containing protein
MRRRSALGLLIALALVHGCAPLGHRRPGPPPRLAEYEATAYSIQGRTAAGTSTRRGIVAADPAVLPLGSRIRLHDAGPYSGEYVVEDTGRSIDGREIDIYVPSNAEARRFGRRRVKVEVLRYGPGAPSPTAGHR